MKDSIKDDFIETCGYFKFWGKKEIQANERAAFLQTFAWTLTVSFLFSVLVGTRVEYPGLLMILSLPFSFVWAFFVIQISGRCGNVAGSFYTGPEANPTERELLTIELEKARYYKGKKGEHNYAEANRLLNDILSKDPDFPEALFLRAQLMLEWKGRSDSAVSYLKRIVELVPDQKSHLNVWARNLIKQIEGSKEGA